MRSLALCLPALFITACSAPAPDAASCAPICADLGDAAANNAAKADGATSSQPAQNTVTLTEFEQGLIGELIEDARRGIQPFAEDSIGVCVKGESMRKCEDFVGSSTGELAEGDYYLFGVFRAPSVGERGTWKVKVETECTTYRTGSDGSESESVSKWEKEYEIAYVGEDRGYPLSPLRRIASPNSAGRQSCTYRIHTLHPDHPQTFEGSWSVPGPA